MKADDEEIWREFSKFKMQTGIKIENIRTDLLMSINLVSQSMKTSIATIQKSRDSILKRLDEQEVSTKRRF